MAKGSQLTQLKTALNKAGLTPQPQNGKKRKRAVLDDKEKERRAAKLKEIQQKMNPFDTKVTKLKHDVGGRKIAGVTGRPAQSKQAGIEQRKKTLLKEYEERGRAGGIVDRRFGENDPTMTPEERMLERFTRERQRASKGDAFNLEDDEELTHYGQSLSKLDDFDNIGLGIEDDEEDEGQIDPRTVQRSHFGGFGDEDEASDDEEGQPERKKSKAEVMAEVIAKSKEHKFMRQQQQEEDENLRHELDQELDSIRSLLFAPDPSTQPSESAQDGDPKPEIPKVQELTQPEDAEYDQFVRELAFEKRAKPKDRTKTEEELALEEKEALEKAERRRIRRMNGEEEDSSDEEEGGGRKKGKRRERGGDDLEDDFMEEEELLGAGLGTGLRDEDDEDEGSQESGDEHEDDDEEESGDEEEEDEGSEMSEDEDEAAGEAGDTEALVKSSRKSSGKKKKTSGTSEELPFTFPCPETHDDFLEIVENIRDEDVPTVVKRIRTLHHPSLAEDNKFKLQALTGVLIDHILYITSPPKPKFTLLSSLIPHIYSLTKSYPIQSAHHFISKLNLMQKNLKRGLSNGVTDPESRTWPGLPELSLLRVIGIVWPTSDMNHHVVSPARLLMGSYLGLCRVRSLKDIASGLFLCTLFLQDEELSKRLVPEAVNFLINAVLHLAPHRFNDVGSLPGGFPSPDFKSERCKPLRIDSKKSKKLSVAKPDLSRLLSGQEEDEQSKVDLLGVTLDLLRQSADMYKSLDGFIELYEPVAEVLRGVTSKNLPEGLTTKFNSVQETLNKLLKFALQSRQPLHLQSHKPIPIPTYIPKFEHTTSNYLRNRDPDHERNEAAKLRAQYKQERKGAIRELRKDARFLAAEQQKKQKEKDREYNERMKRVFGSLEGERAEQKAMEREKQKEKRRAGRE
ncbi:Nop14-like protein [Panus rudis PR-1116 ss-1]|nr:Nop14-like protein [Panus rudis PR-1116 ss-1]